MQINKLELKNIKYFASMMILSLLIHGAMTDFMSILILKNSKEISKLNLFVWM